MHDTRKRAGHVRIAGPENGEVDQPANGVERIPPRRPCVAGMVHQPPGPYFGVQPSQLVHE
jgi:hypothetical protein